MYFATLIFRNQEREEKKKKELIEPTLLLRYKKRNTIMKVSSSLFSILKSPSTSSKLREPALGLDQVCYGIDDVSFPQPWFTSTIL
jgi:tRNA uridine 5-carbamoylmethylation protein Kti12